MTREEAIKQLETELHIVLNRPEAPNKGNFVQAMLMALEALREQEKNRWIPVTERLPEENTRVLVWGGENDCSFPIIDTDRIHKNRWVRWNDYITYWMPLPEPPKEE